MQDEPESADGFLADLAKAFFGTLGRALANFAAAVIVGAGVGGVAGLIIGGTSAAWLGALLGAAAGLSIVLLVASI